MTSTENWFYEPLGSTSRPALHTCLCIVMGLGWFSLQSISNFASACPTLCASQHNSHSPLERVHERVHGSDCCIQPRWMWVPFPLFSQSTLCTCCPHLETLIYLHTLDLLHQLKSGNWKLKHVQDVSSGTCTQRNASWGFIHYRQGIS